MGEASRSCWNAGGMEMVSGADSWSAVALSAAAIPATSVAKGWASLMSSYDMPGNGSSGSDSIPPTDDDTGSAFSPAIIPE